MTAPAPPRPITTYNRLELRSIVVLTPFVVGLSLETFVSSVAVVDSPVVVLLTTVSPDPVWSGGLIWASLSFFSASILYLIFSLIVISSLLVSGSFS